jgi:hypothetical protein
MGIPMVLAGWDLWRMGPTRKQLPPGEDILPDPAPLPDAGLLPRVQKPLPDCLIPKRLPERVRELA